VTVLSRDKTKVAWGEEVMSMEDGSMEPSYNHHLYTQIPLKVRDINRTQVSNM